MTTRLRSLRVTSEMDSSGYARGAQAKVAADNAMISSGDRFGASLANTDMQLQKLPAGMARLSRMWLGGYSEAEKFEKAVRQVGNALDHGMDLDRAVTMLKAIETQFGRTANAAQLAKQGFVSVGAPLATAHVDQSGINAGLGMYAGSAGSAQESAAVFQAAAIQQEHMAASAKALRAEIDPLGTAQDRLNAELLEYQTLANAGVITTQELALAQGMAAAKFDLVSKNIAATGQHFRLARHEIANLSYQLNDVAVMLASGQAPFMLFMQQGMQIGQLLGPRGLGNAVKALGVGIVSFLTNPVNLAVVGFAALAAGAGYAIKLMQSGLPSIEELLKKQKALLDDLGKSYAAMGREVGAMGSESARLIEFQAGLNIEQSRQRIQKDLQAALAGATLDLSSAFGTGGSARIERDLLPFKDVIVDVMKAVDTGQGDVIKLREEIARIGEGFQGDKKIEKLTAELFDALDGVKDLQLQTNQLSLSLDPLASKLSRLFQIKPQDLLGQEPGYGNIQSFIPDTRSTTEQLDETHKAFQRLFGDTQFASQEAVKYQQALDALNGELGKTVALNELEIRSIYAKSPGQKAEIAAQRERINAINTGIKGTELDIRAQHAAAQAYQEATFAITEQNKARLQAANDNVSSQALQLKLVGASAAEQARLTSNLASYLDLQKQAEANGLTFDQKQYELLKQKNAEAARFVELTARQQLATGLDEERNSMGLSGREADVRRDLLSSGIEEGTAAWEDFRMEMLRVKEAQDSVMYGVKEGFDQIRADANDFATSTAGMVSDVYNGLGDALVGFIKTRKLDLTNLFDQMIEDVTRFSYKLAMSGLLNFMGGGSATNTSGLGGIIGGLFKAPGLYAKGDVFDSPTAFAYGNGKTGVMGEDGPEAVVPLRRGRDGKLGIAGGSGGSNVTIVPTVYNNSGKVTARSEVKDDGNGRVDIVTIIEDVTIKTMSGIKGQNLLSAQYGVGRLARSR